MLAIDLETGPPEARSEVVRIHTTGKIAKLQPAGEKIGLDPHRARIQLLQIYGGGTEAYLFRGPALDRLLRSGWLERQRLVAHGAEFEAKFLAHARVEPAPPIECTLQVFGLLFGTRSRSLASASRTVLSIEPPKELPTSIWSAPRLSAGQIAYAASDAVLAYRLWHRISPSCGPKVGIAPMSCNAMRSPR